MKQFSLAVAITVIMMAGCGGTQSPELDNGPTIVGFTPGLRAEMRKVIVEQDPAADAEKIVESYMGKLRGIAKDLKVEPNAAGDYVIPPDKNLKFDESKLRAKGGALEGIKVLEEFGLDLPGWSTPLVNEYKSGSITPEREELLIAVVSAELYGLVRGLSK